MEVPYKQVLAHQTQPPATNREMAVCGDYVLQHMLGSCFFTSAQVGQISTQTPSGRQTARTGPLAEGVRLLRLGHSHLEAIKPSVAGGSVAIDLIRHAKRVPFEQAAGKLRAADL